jgi:2-keto-4-pentenoate hydratase
MTPKIERLAAALAEAWRSDTTIALPEEADAPASRAESFAVQDRLAVLLGERVVGWKVGATVPAVQRLEGHDGPIPGRLFAPRVFDSPAVVPAVRFGGYKVECEFAFRFTRDLPVRGRPYTPAEIAEGLAFHPAVELAGSRYVPGTGGRKPRTHDAIADNGAGGGFVFGPGIADWRGLSFDTMPIVARIDGGLSIEVYTGDYRRDPLVIVAETLNDLAARGIALSAGDYLSTGSLTLPTPIARGQTLVARFGDLAEIRVTVA